MKKNLWPVVGTGLRLPDKALFRGILSGVNRYQPAADHELSGNDREVFEVSKECYHIPNHHDNSDHKSTFGSILEKNCTSIEQISFKKVLK